MSAIVEWLNEHDGIFERLQAANMRLTQQAGRVGRLLEAGDPVGEDALAALHAFAEDFVAIIHDARELPPVPDADTDRHFRAALLRWDDAGSAVVTSCEGHDAGQAHRAARGLEAGADEFLRCAAALRRATGQPPSPTNPKS